jgi:hypothetical protein
MVRRTAAWIGAAMALAGIGVVLSGCASGGDSSYSGTRIRAEAIAAAEHYGTFHFIDRIGQGNTPTQVLVGDAGGSFGQQTLSARTTKLEARFVNFVAYIRSDATVLTRTLGLTAAAAQQNAGKWVSVTPGDPGYAAITKSLEPGSELDSYLPQGKLSVGALTTIGGVKVVPIRGEAPPRARGTLHDVRATLFVRQGAPHVPVGGTISGVTKSGKRQTEVVVFKSWGEKLRLPVPAGAVASSSLPHTSA